MESIPDIKLRQITLTAKDLFWKYGYKKVTIEEVCREAGVSKMTFYKHFSNKTELIKHIMSFIFEDNMRKFRIIIESDIPFTEKVKKQIELKSEGAKGMSDLFFEDLIKSDNPELFNFRREFSENSIKQVMNFFKEAQEQGEIRKDIKLEFILYFLNHSFEMIEDKNLRKFYETPQELLLEATNFRDEREISG